MASAVPYGSENNQLNNCSGIYTGYVENALPGGRVENRDIVFENNTLNGGGYLAYFYGVDENIIVRGNHFTNTSSSVGAATAVFYCCGRYQGVVVESNNFRFMRGPEQTAGFEGERPWFRNNVYEQIEIRDGQGGAVLYGNNGYLRPLFEQSWVASVAGAVSGLVLETAGYPHGQETRMSVGAGSLSLPAVSASFELLAPRTLHTGDALRLRFDRTRGKWIEVP